MKPTRSILDQSFRYVPSHMTDVKATFERIRKEREHERAPAPAIPADPKRQPSATTAASVPALPVHLVRTGPLPFLRLRKP